LLDIFHYKKPGDSCNARKKFPYKNLGNGTSLAAGFKKEIKQLREDENASHLNKHGIKGIKQFISLR